MRATSPRARLNRKPCLASRYKRNVTYFSTSCAIQSSPLPAHATATSTTTTDRSTCLPTRLLRIGITSPTVRSSLSTDWNGIGNLDEGNDDVRRSGMKAYRHDGAKFV